MGTNLFGVPQVSILGPLLSNIFMYGLLKELICLHNTTFVSEVTPKNVLNSLETFSTTLFEWFSNNQTKAQPEKCLPVMNINRPVSIRISKVKTISQTVIVINRLVLKSIFNLVFTFNLKQSWKKPIERYLLLLELHLILVFP